MNRKILILASIIFIGLYFTGNFSNLGGVNNAEGGMYLGGDDHESDMVSDDDSELLSNESDNMLNYVELSDKLPEKEKEILELEKQKEQLQLENEKMKLLELKKNNKKIENKQNQLMNQENTQSNNNNLNGLECNSLHNFNNNNDNYSILNNNDCNSDLYNLPDNYLQNKNEKIKPSELLPANSVDMKGENFLTAALSQNSEQIIGKPTQTHRSRLNYDLRSTPPNPQVEVSPWNMSTMVPDTERRTFEIGAPANEVVS